MRWPGSKRIRDRIREALTVHLAGREAHDDMSVLVVDCPAVVLSRRDHVPSCCSPVGSFRALPRALLAAEPGVMRPRTEPC